MKEFRIGQRVRIISSLYDRDKFIGRCGTVTSCLVKNKEWWVQDVALDGLPTPESHQSWCFEPCEMEPIDDDIGDWGVIEHMTGWSPIKEKVEP